MPKEYHEHRYDYQTDGNFTTWLESKDNDDGKELVTVLENRSNYEDQHIIRCIFVKDV